MSTDAEVEFDPSDPTTWADTITGFVSICRAGVCTKATDEEATSWLNLEAPTGISSRWQVDTGMEPLPCPDDPARRHVEFFC